MDKDFKELNSNKPLEDYGESDALWFEPGSEREKRWLREDMKALIMREIKKIAQEVLTEKLKQVFDLYLKNKSQREIGSILSISRNSVKSRWKGIIKNLQKNTTHLAYYWKLSLVLNMSNRSKTSKTYIKRWLKVQKT